MMAPAPLTADDLMRLQPPDKRVELIRGQMIVREPGGFRRGRGSLARRSSGEVDEKIADWLKAGTQLVWVIDPDRRQARMHRANGTVSVIIESEDLDGEEVLPGFSSTLARLL